MWLTRLVYSVGFISQVERGITTPSLGSLASLAKALQTDTRDFLNPPEPEHATYSSDTRNAIPKYCVGVSYRRLSSSFPGATLHSVIIIEPPSDRVDPVSHYGEEMLYIIRGEITIELDGEESVLCKGDSIHFDSQRYHSIWNHSTEKAVFMWSGTMDIFNESASPIHKKFTSDKPIDNHKVD